MLDMFFWGAAGNQKIINVSKTEAESMQDLVHEALEGLPRISEAKWNSNNPKGVIMAVKSCMWGMG